MTRYNFKLPNYYLVEVTPFVLVFCMGFFINENWFEKANKQAIIVFASVLIFIYLHFAFYISISWRLVQKVRKAYKSMLQTKSQKAIFQWLQVLVIGFIAIWVSYFLNIIENTVPYVIGPIVYSVVVYFLSYKAFQLKATDIDGDAFKESDDRSLFNQISTLVVEEKLYLEPDVSLASLSKLIGKSTQKTSEVVNQYAKRNFNDYINYHRVQDAKRKLLDVDTQNFTISSIAFDSGFSSLSSFNSAFKKFEGTTPSLYRKNNVM